VVLDPTRIVIIWIIDIVITYKDMDLTNDKFGCLDPWLADSSNSRFSNNSDSQTIDSRIS
jgi:hypothetical protein